jgi:streptomycin 6-kinase
MGQFADLARAAAECRDSWALTLDGAFPQRYRHVEPVRTRDGAAAVLKLGPPADREWQRELDALEWFASVRVLAVDRERGAVLMQRVLPGTRLVDSDLDDEAATAVAAGVMAALWRPGRGDFPSVREWGRALDGRPAAVFAELCDSMGEEVVLHGDLHHENILRSGDGWVAIDPKGVIGEREYETGALLRNPIPVLHDTRTLERRADQLAEALGLDGVRIRAWAWAQAHLAAAWSVEDGEDPSYWLAVAERLEPLTGR